MILFLTLIFINFICASCNEGQIDINTATEKELEKLSGIGPVKANAIIDSRPIDSFDDLIKVNGIGEVTLEKIKEQGLACVENEKTKEEENKDTNADVNEDDSKESNSLEDNNFNINSLKNNSYSNLVSGNENMELTLIILNSDTKNIKSEDNEELNTKSYAIYGLIGFCILLAFLFVFRKIRNRKYKNEFE